ncbi:MAG: NAD(P)H-dependent glycerol-3-phosphate dehydrogenase [Acidobacteriota bacterium]
MSKIAIVGAGSWGTALACVLSQKGHSVQIWAFEPEVVKSVNSTRTNPLFLPEVTLPDRIRAYDSLAGCLHGAEIVIVAVPSHHFANVFESLLPSVKSEMTFVSATKGLENHTLRRMSQIMESLLPRHSHARLAAISGPSFAKEVAKGEPAALVVASRERSVAEWIQQEFSGPSLRLYTSCDLIGVELGGSVKNVIAIAAGVLTGVGLGSNAMAALITRGLAEMTRLALACGARRETLSGLAGIGDLVLTCTGALSRNRTVGVKLGQGQKLEEIVRGMRMVAEGILTTRATLQLADLHRVEMPIARQMDLVLHQGKAPRDAIRELMERPLKEEA